VTGPVETSAVLPTVPGVLAGELAGRGERVVLVHGFTQTGRSWRAIAARLAASYEVLTVDLPDHGRSAQLHAAGLDDAAAALGRTAGRATYVGYSLGGRVCLTLALADPSLVERLVLVGASPGIDSPSGRAERRRSDEALADRIEGRDGSPGLTLEEFLAEWIAGPLFAHLSPAQADLGSRRENTVAGLAASLRSLGAGTQEPSLARLHGLDMPVLALAGEKDLRYRAVAAEMARAIGANSSYALVEGAGHAAPFEEPARFTAMLEHWLAPST